MTYYCRTLYKVSRKEEIIIRSVRLCVSVVLYAVLLFLIFSTLGCGTFRNKSPVDEGSVRVEFHADRAWAKDETGTWRSVNIDEIEGRSFDEVLPGISSITARGYQNARTALDMTLNSSGIRVNTGIPQAEETSSQKAFGWGVFAIMAMGVAAMGAALFFGIVSRDKRVAVMFATAGGLLFVVAWGLTQLSMVRIPWYVWFLGVLSLSMFLFGLGAKYGWCVKEKQEKTGQE